MKRLELLQAFCSREDNQCEDIEECRNGDVAGMESLGVVTVLN